MILYDYILGRLRLGDITGGGGTVDGVTEVGPTVVLPGGPYAVDAVPYATITGAKWFVSIESGADRQVTEVYAKISASPTGNNNMTLGDAIDYTLSISAVGPNVVLSITNNTGANITFTALRLTF